MKKRKNIILAVVIIILSVAADQITKVIAENILTDEGYIPLFGDAIGFELVHNPGAFLGMFSDARWAFMLPSLLIIGVMTVWLFLKKNPSPLFAVSVALLIGGGIGNMIDRLYLEYVIDFISLRFINFPNFNIADSCVTIGCILFAICALLPGSDVFDLDLSAFRKKKPKEQSDESGIE